MDLRANGATVASFSTRLHNLYRVGELVLNVADMYLHGPWRAYEHNAGPVRWRECEFDYFLISVGAPRDDIARIVAWNRIGASLAPGMQSDDPRKRRPFEQAAAAWPSDTGESLVERAQRLGWISKKQSDTTSPRTVSVVSSYARAVASEALPLGKRAQRYRGRTAMDQLSPARRQALDARIERLTAGLTDLERLYVRARVAGLAARGGRPKANHAQWRKDVLATQGDSRVLAARWNVNRETAKKRVQLVRGKNA
jgi:hypothetical protein